MKEKTLSSKKIFQGKVISLRVDEIITKGDVKGEREVISHNGGSAVLAVKDGKILLERQFRYPYGEEIWEIPAGKRDKDEEFIQTAKRELEEETGLIPLNLKQILTLYPSPGYTDEIIGVFFADNFKQGKLKFDDTEFLTSQWVDEQKVYEMIDSGEIKDAKTLVAILWYKASTK